MTRKIKCQVKATAQPPTIYIKRVGFDAEHRGVSTMFLGIH